MEYIRLWRHPKQEKAGIVSGDARFFPFAIWDPPVDRKLVTWSITGTQDRNVAV